MNVERLVDPAVFLSLTGALTVVAALLLSPVVLVALMAGVAVVTVALLSRTATLTAATVYGFTCFLLMQPLLRQRIGGPANYGDELFALAVWGGLFVWGALREGNPFAVPNGWVFVALWGVFLTSGVLNGVTPVVILLGILATAKGMAMYWLGYHLRPSRGELRGFLWLFAAVGGVAVAVAAMQRFTPGLARRVVGSALQVTTSGGARAMGIFSHPKELGQVLIILLALMLGAWTLRQMRTSVAVAIGALAVVGIGLSMAKSSLAMVVVVLLILGMLRSGEMVYFGFTGVCLVAVAVPFLPVPDGLAYRVEGLRNGLEAFSTGTFEGNFAWRTYNIYKTAQVVQDHPVLGVGTGQWGGFIAKSTDSPVYREYRMKSFIIRQLAGLDIDWLRTLGEGGFVATLIFLLLLWQMQRQAYWAYRHLPEAHQRAFALSVLLFNVFIFVESLTSQLFEAPFLSFYFWGFNGVLAGWIAACDQRSLMEGAPVTITGKDAPAGQPVAVPANLRYPA